MVHASDFVALLSMNYQQMKWSGAFDYETFKINFYYFYWGDDNIIMQ